MVRREKSREAVRPEPSLRGLVARGVIVVLNVFMLTVVFMAVLLFTLLVGEPIMIVVVLVAVELAVGLVEPIMVVVGLEEPITVVVGSIVGVLKPSEAVVELMGEAVEFWVVDCYGKV